MGRPEADVPGPGRKAARAYPIQFRVIKGMGRFVRLTMWHRAPMAIILSGTFWQIGLLSLDAPKVGKNSCKDQHKLFVRLPSAPAPRGNLPREIPTPRVFPSSPSSPDTHATSGLPPLRSPARLGKHLGEKNVFSLSRPHSYTQ